MKALAWQRLLVTQRDRHGKVLFTVTELAHVAGRSGAALNIELTRLRTQGIIVQYAWGLYGLPDAVTPDALIPAIDTYAYITGSYALFRHGIITQAPTRITCFTQRRSTRARERDTPAGRIEFVFIQGPVYHHPGSPIIASPEQALCDFAYRLRRQHIPIRSQVTFRNLARLNRKVVARTLARYPATVATDIRDLLA